MAKKNTAPDSSDEKGVAFRLPRYLQDTARKQYTTSAQSMRKDHGTEERTSNGTVPARRIRNLPVHRSLATQDSGLIHLNEISPRKGHAARTSPAKAIRATSARRATNKSEECPSPATSTSSTPSNGSDKIWCDARSDSSSFADSSEPTSDIDSSPVRWPAEKILSTKLPRKRGSSHERQTEGLDSDLDLILRGTKALQLQPRKASSQTKVAPDESEKENQPVLRPSSPQDLFTNPSLSPSKSRLKSPSKRSPSKPDPPDRPSTPQNRFTTPSGSPSLSPTKSRLQSPSKKPPRIPTPPGRPSIDAFWDADHINSWNEAYSPRKPLMSPGKHFSPGGSPTRPLPTPSPRKSRASLARRRAFDDAKTELAATFLAELDTAVCNGAVSAATAATGGVRLVWSKTLQSTAGRASWKRSGSSGMHSATVELATKILTDEARLRSTLAHEFCHLATYIVSGVLDRPHGPEFRAWGRKCEDKFPDVVVSVKHAYQVEWRYLWACAGCGQEYGRHSRSIDPNKVRCGGCKGALVQIRPAPRKAGETKGFAGFIKTHFRAVKEMMPGVAHAEVMEELGRRWRAAKAGAVDEVAAALAVVVIDD